MPCTPARTSAGGILSGRPTGSDSAAGKENTMNRNEGQGNASAATRAEHPSHGKSSQGARAWRGMGGALAAVAALMVVAAGCGDARNDTVADSGVTPGTVIIPAYETSADIQMAASSGEAEGLTTANETGGGSAAAGFPPDIIVTASDSVAAPGEVIEIMVQGTPDVTEVSLWDGYGDRQALVYDAEAKAWRVAYRVPLRLPWERTGLAITAKNDSQRWCRSWVFVRTREDTPMAAEVGSSDSASPDTGGEK
jgi:hypothetical protein